MYIEDMIDRLASNGNYIFREPLQLWSRDVQIIGSFSDQINRGLTLTEKQANMAIGFCKKYKKQLEDDLKINLDLAINSPQFKNPFRVIGQTLKEVSLIDGPPKKIQVSFKYDENLVKLFKEHKARSDVDIAQWNPDASVWHLSLTEGNILFVKTSLIPNGFRIDPKITEFIEKIDEISLNFESHVPMVSMEGNRLFYKNTHPSVPQPTNNNIVESLIKAREYAITVWDDLVENYVNSKIIPFTARFLKTRLGEKIELNSNVTPIEQFSDIVRYSKNVLIIVPGGNELFHLKNWYDFLISEEFSEKDMSVFFRLDNSKDKEFNNFIKEKKLNSPLTPETRIFFVSQKLPKPLIKNHQNFGAVINLGSNHAPHYSIQNILLGHHDIITYNKKK